MWANLFASFGKKENIAGVMKGSNKPQILAISGSTRKNSINHSLIIWIKEQVVSEATMEVFDGIAALPHFNPDNDHENAPEPVQSLREKIKKVSGILICSPEYAMGVPGALKNMLDWMVSSCEFSGKPVALITASSQGYKAHESLLGTLRIIEAHIPEPNTLLIPFVKAKIDPDGVPKDDEVVYAIKQLISSFLLTIHKD